MARVKDGIAGKLDLSPVLVDRIRGANARVTVGYPWWLRLLLARNVVAITLGRRVYVSPSYLRRPLSELEILLRHELAHVAQVARLGLLRFLVSYVREYVALRRRGLPASEAYRAISFEVEAFAAESDV